MPRPKRADDANCIYHALNRGNARCAIFKKDADYHAFERILAEGLERCPGEQNGDRENEKGPPQNLWVKMIMKECVV